MFRGANRLLAASLVLGLLLLAPPAALACGGGPSAENVYKECVPTGGGGHPTRSGTATPASGTATPVSGKTALALKHAGKDRRVLATLVHNDGVHPFLGTPAASGGGSSPGALKSALDLVGPTALLIVLAGTAVLLLGGSGVRVWRGRNHL